MKQNRLLQLTVLFIALGFIFTGIWGYINEEGENQPADPDPIMSFRDIPDITEAEIDAIEALQRQYESFSYGMFPSTEAFIKADGTIGGYTALFCDWLTGLFEIPFIPEVYSSSELPDKLESGELDFLGSTMPTEERERIYFLTETIAERKFITVRLTDSPSIEEIPMPRYAVAANTPVGESVASVLEPGTYEIVPVRDYYDAYDVLVSGRADAYVASSITESVFIGYDDIIIEDFYPLLFNPVSMAAAKAKPELETVILVVDKALHGGADHYVNELYKQGYRDYQKYAISESLTDEERAYIAATPVVPVAAFNINYPLSFYNDREDEWQGIYFDLLGEVTAMTGLVFEVGHGREAVWPDLREKLLSGELALVPEMIPTAELEEIMVWSDTKITEDYFALISKSETPNVTLNEIPLVKVGMAQGTGYASMFKQWFPNHNNYVEYVDIEAAFNALQNDEVDMVMSTQRRLMYLTHYQELAGYKANIVFNQYNETRFATHKSHAPLMDIIDKVFRLTDVEGITNQWSQQTYDFRVRVAEAQRPWLIGAVVLSVTVLVLMVVVFMIYYRNRKASVEQAVLRESEERVQMLLDSAPLSVNLLDKDFQCVFVNEEAARLYGLASKQEYMDLFATGNLSDEKGIDHIRKAYTEGFCRCEMTFRKPGGEPIPCELTLVRVVYNGENAIAAYARDLREEKAAAEKIHETEEQKRVLELVALREQEANQLKSRFLATVSHEIRTPMNAILGMAELALKEEKPDAKDRHIYTVKQAGKNLLTIINDVLDFSKIEAGKMDIIPEYYQVRALLDDLVNITRTRTVDSNISFIVKADSRIPGSLYGDEKRVRQAVLNILSNAFKYTDEGFVSFSVYGEPAGDDTFSIVFEITDSGIGIKPDDMDKLFTDFTQLSTETNRNVEGIGLGLAITNSIVKAMDGDITVRSEYGKGSTFTVKLPQKYRSQDTLAAVADSEAVNALICEPHEIFADSLAYTLDNLGISNTTVVDEAGLIAEMDSKTYDYLFISHALYEQSKDVISKSGESTQVVVFTELGEAVRERKLKVITMPVYCAPVADVINGAHEETAQSAASDAEPSFVAPQARVLIVDDIKSNLAVAKGLIEPYKMQIELCNSGAEAIEAVQRAAAGGASGGSGEISGGSGEATGGRYDIIFMDHKMPGMDGVEATKRIRALGETELPIVALTANVISGMMEVFLESGFNDFLSKPIDTARLKMILERWIPKDKWESAEP